MSATAGRPSLRAVVFDLDDTLFDCFGQCVGPAHGEAARAMVAAGLRAAEEDVLRARLSLTGSLADVDLLVASCFPCDDPLAAAEAGRRAFFDRDPGFVLPHPFTRSVLAAVRATALAVLVTTGSPATQRTKIERLGIAADFDEVLLDNVFGPGSVGPGRDGGASKRDLIASLLARRSLPPSQVLVVGDRPSSEIRAALDLGCSALRIRAGEFAGEPTPPGVPEAGDVRAVLAWLPGRGPAAMLDAGHRPGSPAR